MIISNSEIIKNAPPSSIYGNLPILVYVNLLRIARVQLAILSYGHFKYLNELGN